MYHQTHAATSVTRQDGSRQLFAEKKRGLFIEKPREIQVQ